MVIKLTQYNFSCVAGDASWGAYLSETKRSHWLVRSTHLHTYEGETTWRHAWARGSTPCYSNAGLGTSARKLDWETSQRARDTKQSRHGVTTADMDIVGDRDNEHVWGKIHNIGHWLLIRKIIWKASPFFVGRKLNIFNLHMTDKIRFNNENEVKCLMEWLTASLSPSCEGGDRRSITALRCRHLIRSRRLEFSNHSVRLVSINVENITR